MVTHYLMEVIGYLKHEKCHNFHPDLRNTFQTLYWDSKRIDDGSQGSREWLEILSHAYHEATVQRDILRHTVGNFNDIDKNHEVEQARICKRIIALLDLALAQFHVSLNEMAWLFAETATHTVGATTT